MCELSVYAIKGQSREKVMEGVVRLTVQNGKVLMEGIFGESLEVAGKLTEVNIITQTADILSEF